MKIKNFIVLKKALYSTEFKNYTKNRKLVIKTNLETIYQQHNTSITWSTEKYANTMLKQVLLPTLHNKVSEYENGKKPRKKKIFCLYGTTV